MNETTNLGGGRARVNVPLRLDILAKQLAGTELKGTVEAMLKSNPGLADAGPYADEGLAVAAPERPEAEAVIATINPWS
jgi:phage tail protein X